MRYLGGKSRLAAPIMRAISSAVDLRKFKRYCEPFVGGGAVLVEACKYFMCPKIAGDRSLDLILLFRALQSGWTPPTTMTLLEYNAQKTAAPSAMRGFAGFPCSFGGKWFGGMARGGGRNHVAEGSRACMKKGAALQGVQFLHKDFLQWQFRPGDFIYADPPYADTTGYAAAGSWDATVFWAWADAANTAGAIVVVSELSAPAHWHQIWGSTRGVGQTVNCSGTAREARTDALFMARP